MTIIAPLIIFAVILILLMCVVYVVCNDDSN
jgi:hypothetical protein